MARRPYAWLAACSDVLAELASCEAGRRIAPHEILIDAPPMQLEVEFRVDICFPKERAYRTLGDVSPVVRTLARKQFDDYVKKVRVFAHRDLAENLRARGIDDLIQKAIDRTEGRSP